jgi:hypothetical protein
MKLPPPTLLAFIIPLLLVIGKPEPTSHPKQYKAHQEHQLKR